MRLPIRPTSTRGLFVLVGALVLVEVMFYSALAPLLPYYSHRLHLSKSGAGLLTASYAIGTLVFAVPLGMLVARIGVKPATVAGAALLAAASVVFGFSHSAVILDSARFVQGIAGIAVWIASLTWLAGVMPTERRGETVGAVLGIGIGGALLGPVIGSAAVLSGPRLVFSALAALILALAGWALVTPGPDDLDATPMRGAVRAMTHDRRLLGGMWFTALPAMLLGILDVLAPLRLSGLGATTVAVGAVFLMSAVLEASTSPVFGRLSDRIGPRPLIHIGLVCSAALGVILPLPDAAWLVGATTVLAGAVFGISWVPASALLSTGADELELHPSFAYALWGFAWALGLAIGSAAGAPLAQATDDAVPYGIVAALCLSTLLVMRRHRVPAA